MTEIVIGFALLDQISQIQYSGNLYRHGDSPAEANHSSFVSRIGKQSSVYELKREVRVFSRYGQGSLPDMHNMF
jgi:hypothetical protein